MHSQHCGTMPAATGLPCGRWVTPCFSGSPSPPSLPSTKTQLCPPAPCSPALAVRHLVWWRQGSCIGSGEHVALGAASGRLGAHISGAHHLKGSKGWTGTLPARVQTQMQHCCARCLSLVGADSCGVCNLPTPLRMLCDSPARRLRPEALALPLPPPPFAPTCQTHRCPPAGPRRMKVESPCPPPPHACAPQSHRSAAARCRRWWRGWAGSGEGCRAAPPGATRAPARVGRRVQHPGEVQCETSTVGSSPYPAST